MPSCAISKISKRTLGIPFFGEARDDEVGAGSDERAGAAENRRV